MSPKNLFKSNLLAAAVAVSAPLAYADKATYESDDGSKMVIEYEGENVRMTTSSDNSYMLLKDGEVYSVSREGDQWTVMPIGEFMGAMTKAAESKGLLKGIGDAEYEQTGRRETVAGISGEVFRITQDDKEYEAVMTQDKDVAAATVAMVSFSAAMVNMDISDTPLGSEMKGWGMLSSKESGEFTLVSIDTRRSSAERFELPAEPMELGLGKLFGSTPKQETKKPDSTETAEEVADKADAYEDAVDSVTDLGESVGKAWNKLFGKD